MTLIKLDDLKEFVIFEGIVARIVNSESMTVAHVNVDEGVILPEHKHRNEQIINVIEGELEMVVDGERRILKPGVVEVLPPEVHIADAL